jgi:helicase MOV-10
MGDFIRVKHSDSTEDTWYEGRVHFVYEHSVSLHFGDEFSTYKGTKFDVRFVLNRLPHRRMHDAIHRCHGGHGRLLFPTPYHASKLSLPTRDQLRDIVPFNRLVGGNPEQLSTVASILHLPPGSCPFIVFGPPGTGKTVTIVEAIRQLLHRDDKVKILVCAPSNSAADLVATKLIDGVDPLYLCRLNSLSRKYKDLPEVLRVVSHYNDHLTFEIPDREKLAEYRVVVATCISGAIPSGLKIDKGHFSHIFIDEAGQAKEPESMVPILTMADEKTNVVLAGDNQQLGPVLHSPLAGALGLKVSYLSRLMDRPLYNLGNGEQGSKPGPDNVRGGGRGLCIVKLVKNFRSHPSILKFPNKTFYRNELQPCGDVVITHSLERLDELPTKRFPLIFHGIVGKDQREGSSPSFFNIEEATQVKKYCMELTSRGRKNRVDPKDIGVITPYHMQRHKISTLLAKSKLQGIKVGSVEEFQGQERKVIVLSTVRSSNENVMADIRRNLGFVAEPRRFNVAITRARALLIVIGNPQILSLDPLWRSFLNYIHTNGGWRGREVNWNPTETVRPGTQSFDGEVSKRVAQQQEEMMNRIRELITRVERSDGFALDDYPEGDVADDEDVHDFIPERGTFSREDE